MMFFGWKRIAGGGGELGEEVGLTNVPTQLDLDAFYGKAEASQ